MKKSDDAVSHEEIDRLVDGELSDADRRSLLVRLDRHPGGWRACALAFLEAAAWRVAADSLVSRATPSASAPPVRGTPGPDRLLLRWLSLAATVLLAFGIGAIAGNRWTGVSAPVAEQGAGERPGLASVDTPPSEVEAPPSEPGSEPGDSDVEIVGLVRIGDEEAAQRAMPIVSGPGLDEDWLRAQPKLLPERDLRQLERRGWRVQQGRQLFSVELRDGRRLTIPLDSVKYQFVGNEVY